MQTNSKNPDFRPDLYLVARIIYSLSTEGEMNRTRLSVCTGLAYDRMINYLYWLQEKGLVSEDESFVRITEKGMNSYNKLVDWIFEYVGKLDFPRRRD